MKQSDSGIRTLAVSGFLLFSFFVLTVAYASAPTTSFALSQQTRYPSEREQQIFGSILHRLQRNAPAMPIAINEALRSLEEPVSKTFSCPVESAVESVDVRIETRHVSWDDRLAVEHSMGTYYWNVEMVSDSKRVEITARNWVMIDPHSTGIREAAFMTGAVTNEALLYHEMLHGQLLISAMETAAWQHAACAIEVRLGGENTHHSVINPAVSRYVRDRSSSDGDSLGQVLRVVGVAH